MTNWSVGYLSALRRACVGHIVGPLAVVFLTPVFAHAGAWEEFETRCLVPMENVALEQPADVKADKNFKNDGDTYSQYELKTARLRVGDGNGQFAHWCDVIVRGAGSVDFMNAGLAWSEAAQRSGRYEKIEDLVLGFVLRSTQWREPKIDVSMTMAMKGGQFTLRVEETDLEA